MKPQITQIFTDNKTCHCERLKGAWQSHTQCQFDDRLASHQHDPIISLVDS